MTFSFNQRVFLETPTKGNLMILFRRAGLAAFAFALSCAPSFAQKQAPESDVPSEFKAPTGDYNYVKRVEMIPMRDGVKLYTVIVIPKGAAHVPILLTRTPYNAAGRTARNDSPFMLDTLPQGDEFFVKAGYIRVFQDV